MTNATYWLTYFFDILEKKHHNDGYLLYLHIS